MSGPVLVGVDGSATSMAAVEAAAREADRLGVELRLAHALDWPAAPLPPGLSPWDPAGTGAGGSAQSALTQAERRAHGAAPGLRVTHTVLLGEPSQVLAAESRGVSLTVVGSRPASRSGGGRRGSVAVRLAAGEGPSVLMVRGRPDPAGPVGLAAGDGPAGRRAAEFAFAEAAARRADVVVLADGGPPNGSPPERAHDTLSELGKKYPDVGVRRHRVRGGTRRAVIEASRHAQLVVIGPRGRRHLRAAALPDLVGRAALRHADCPVAVIRPAGDDR